ncbi:MAG: response regulator transcription factor [Bacteroidales bacterium]|nr:response regulator transcription factor [Bacteroidales bacterium]
MESKIFKILVVDDEKDVREFLGYNLRKEGYNVLTAKNGREAVHIAFSEKPHLIILDVMMPEMDGIETCNELRRIDSLKNTIIIFLTARSEDYSQIAGFEAGGDDYVAKPVKPKVLVTRVKALLKRYRNDDIPESIMDFEGFSINPEKFVVIRDSKEITLPKKEFELLMALASRPNKVFSREEIFSKVWGSNVIVGDRTIDVHIRKIREKLGIESIKTVKGVGYKFEA